jgi:hypothetical protein
VAATAGTALTASAATLPVVLGARLTLAAPGAAMAFNPKSTHALLLTRWLSRREDVPSGAVAA